jgi:replicative DNA helicase
VTIINAEDYGRAIYDLALRRSLITIGEDMVNIAYDAPLDMPPQKSRSRMPSAACSNWPRPAATTAASRVVQRCGGLAIDMAGAAYRARRRSRASPPASSDSTPAWAACSART